MPVLSSQIHSLEQLFLYTKLGMVSRSLIDTIAMNSKSQMA